jgi:hypothetical protein
MFYKKINRLLWLATAQFTFALLHFLEKSAQKGIGTFALFFKRAKVRKKV